MIWLYDLPTWLLRVLILTSCTGFSLLGLFLTHGRLQRSNFASLIDNGTVGWFFSGVSLLYGLLLGLLTVATWGNYSQASNIASQEASSIAVLYRDLTGYSPMQRACLERELRQYAECIIRKSWPRQRRGESPDQENRFLMSIQDSLLLLEPKTNGQILLHTEAIGAFNRMVDFRRQRTESLEGSVPCVLWSVVILGGWLTIVFSYLFVVKQYKLHALLTGIMAAMIGLLIFLLVVLDHPYWGEVSVSADAYQRVVDTVMRPRRP